ncbi:uncharacterized protein LOC127705291 [Mytilus californianus]|uniref:uncharacterized protein LOC127705291 n=1 Tax=Mytilus californianus TaxID=6549 RepID=UPI002245A16B|nr:uncharacterized protein LOC127705291 [Mytilus californianus]
MDPDIKNRFEEEILKVAETDEHFLTYKTFARNFKDKCFIKTKFHNHFLEVIKAVRKGALQKERIVGIQGIGKSSSVMYHVLSCRKNGDGGIHYVDLSIIEKKDKNLEKFSQYIASVKNNDCLVIDHVTLFNGKLVEKIEELTSFAKIVLIESRFTACVYTTNLDFNKDFQLDLNDFERIWNGMLSVKSTDFPGRHELVSSLLKLGDKVYYELKDKFIVTPRLLHDAFDEMFIFGKKINEISYCAEIKLREEIAMFKDELKSSYCETFLLDTKLLLDCLVGQGKNIICTLSQVANFKVAINIFDIKILEVTRQDLEDNCRFYELELEEGDRYVTISHLVPFLGQHWIEKLPLKLEEVLNCEDANRILDFSLQNGSLRKMFKDGLVNCQVENDCVIIPDKHKFFDTCSLEASDTNEYIQCDGVMKPRKLYCLRPKNEIVKDAIIQEKYKGHLANVCKAAVYVKREIEKCNDQSFIIYPHVTNFMGFDYFLYTQPTLFDSGSSDESSSSPPSKKSKNRGMLFLVRVATGSLHTGITMSRALSVFKDIIDEVTLHVVVINATKESDTYNLTGNYIFKNISIVNIGAPHILNSLKFYDEKFHSLLEAVVKTSVVSSCKNK